MFYLITSGWFYRLHMLNAWICVHFFSYACSHEVRNESMLVLVRHSRRLLNFGLTPLYTIVLAWHLNQRLQAPVAWELVALDGRPTGWWLNEDRQTMIRAIRKLDVVATDWLIVQRCWCDLGACPYFCPGRCRGAGRWDLRFPCDGCYYNEV